MKAPTGSGFAAMCADSGAAKTAASRCSSLPAMGDISAATAAALGRVPTDDAPLSDRERLHVWAALYFSQSQVSAAEVAAAVQALPEPEIAALLSDTHAGVERTMGTDTAAAAARSMRTPRRQAEHLGSARARSLKRTRRSLGRRMLVAGVALSERDPDPAPPRLGADSARRARRSLACVPGALGPPAPPRLRRWSTAAADVRAGGDRRAAAARRRDVPASVLRAAADADDIWARALAAGNPRTPSAAVTAAVSTDPHRAARAAANVACGAAGLAAAAGSPAAATRAAAAANRSCGAATLRVLAADLRANVRAAAASSPACTPDLLERLASDGDMSVAAAAAANVSCPPDVLKRLAASRHWQVATAVAGNVSCPPDVLDQLAASGVAAVIKALINNPACGPGLLLRVAVSGEEARNAVERSPGRLLIAAELSRHR